jgi:uncharacterized membrane protein YbhN (UPF0104 family)
LQKHSFEFKFAIIISDCLSTNHLYSYSCLISFPHLVIFLIFQCCVPPIWPLVGKYLNENSRYTPLNLLKRRILPFTNLEKKTLLKLRAIFIVALLSMVLSYFVLLLVLLLLLLSTPCVSNHSYPICILIYIMLLD